MTPVVNGLEERYGSQVEFLILNAGFGEGKEAFEYYRLPGHPSFLLLDPEGEVKWQAFGSQTEVALEDALIEALSTSESGSLILKGS